MPDFGDQNGRHLDRQPGCVKYAPGGRQGAGINQHRLVSAERRAENGRLPAIGRIDLCPAVIAPAIIPPTAVAAAVASSAAAVIAWQQVRRDVDIQWTSAHER